MGNQVLCTKAANIEKGHRTPWIAWGDVQWKIIEACTRHLPAENVRSFCPGDRGKFFPNIRGQSGGQRPLLTA